MSIEGPTPATPVPALTPASAPSAVSTKDVPPRYSLSSEPPACLNRVAYGAHTPQYPSWMHKVVGAMRRLRHAVKYEHIHLILVQPEGLDTPPSRVPYDENHRAVSLVAIP
ncbi:hypothetical protein B0H10DRAFT_2210043 [Mycena sp. CBHHK59/15]|nr:hypothetical protein B0H10DRAFT_2210043 [Mycena sp. CBHHK59/15]